MSNNKTFIFWGNISSTFNRHSARDLISVAALQGSRLHIYGIQLAKLACSMDTLLSDTKITFHLPLTEQHNRDLDKYPDWEYDWTDSTGPYELAQTLPNDYSCCYVYFTLGDVPIHDEKLMNTASSSLLKQAKLFWCYYNVAQKTGNYYGTPLNMRSPLHTYDFCSNLKL